MTTTARRRSHAPARTIVVQQIGSVILDATAATAAVVTVTKPTAVGDNVVACVKLPSGHTVSSITDTQGNTWASDIVDPNGAQAIAQIWRSTLKKALVVGDQVSVNLPASDATVTVILLGISGLRVNPLDRTASNHYNGSGSSSNTATTSSTNQANEVAISAFGVGGPSGNNITYTPPPGWTELSTGQSIAYCDAAYLILTAQQTVSATWNDTASSGGTNFQNSSQVIATYRGA